MGFIRLTPNDKRSTTYKVSPEEKRAYYKRMVKNHIEDLRKDGASDEEVAKFKNGLSDFVKKEINPTQKPIVAFKGEGATVAEALFNVIYSVDIPVEIKEATLDVVECFPVEISEDCVSEEVNSFIEFLDSIVYSSASEELVQQVLDEVLPSLGEAFINEVSDEWIRRKTDNAIKQRTKAYNQAKGNVIGMATLDKANKAQDRLDAAKNYQPKARDYSSYKYHSDTTTPSGDTIKKDTGAMSKLKSAVGKVKQAVTGNKKDTDYVGLSRMIGAKANKDNIGAETLRQQTTHNVEAPRGTKTTTNSETPSRQEKISKLRQNLGRTDKSKGEEMTPEDRMKALKKLSKYTEKKNQEANSQNKNNEIGKDLDTAFSKSNFNKSEVKQPEGEQQKFDFEGTNKTGEGRTKAAASIANSNKNEKGNDKSGSNKPIVAAKVDYQQKLNDAQKQLASLQKKMASVKRDTTRTRYQDQINKLQKSIKGYEKKLAGVAHEALAELAITLLSTNISESCFVEVMEMVAANKANAQKALARDEDNAMAVIDDINKDLQAGKPVDPEKVKKAEELRKKKEHFEKMFNDKFNNNQ